MKRLLLDTHVLLWWLIDSPSLNERSKNLISNGRNQVYVSAASIWEIYIKKALGKLEAPENLESIVEQENFLKLPISLYHAQVAGQLPLLHRDPFDRMLIAQAQTEGMTILSTDLNFKKYNVKIIYSGA